MAIFIGNGKVFGQYGSIGGSICLDDIPPEHIKTSAKNGKRYVSININANKNGVDKFNNTHNLTINEWQPNQQPAHPNIYGTPKEDDPFNDVNVNSNNESMPF